MSNDSCLINYIPRFGKVPLQNLQSLVVLRYTDVDGRLLNAMLGKCHKNIVRLNLFGSKIHDSTLVLMGRLCPRLRCCGLASTGIKDNVLIEFSQYCPNIAHLDLSYNGNVTDIGILGTVLNLKWLQSLEISRMNLITDASLQYIHTHCSNTLHTLHMYAGDGSLLRSDTVENNLFERCVQLRVLHTNLPYIFSQQAICNLTTLVLNGDCVSSHSLKNVGKHCSRLEVLFMQGYTHQGLLAVCLGCTQLKRLYLDLEFTIESSVEEAQDRTELVVFSLELWKKVRPGLIIDDINSFVYTSVMNMV